MDSKGARKPIAELPADDGALDRALAEVDAKLTTWLAAMSAALRAVQDRDPDAAPGQAPATIADDSVEQEPGTCAETPSAEGAADLVGAAPEPEAAADEPPQETSPAETDPAEAAALASAEVGQESSSAELPALGDQPPDETAESATCEQTESADDEELLASLDEQTQAAIRVKRRLFGNQRSVRELLDEMSRPEPVQEATKPQAKRWWRRRSS